MHCIYKRNSKNIREGDVFFSIKGMFKNGNEFIFEAIDRGAKKVLAQRDNPLTKEQYDYIQKRGKDFEYVENIYEAFALSLKKFYGIDETDFTLFGVTGTKGKTTTAHCIFRFLKELNIPAGLMSSAGHFLDNESFTGEGLTTEMADVIYPFLFRAKQKKIKHIVLEVSSHAFSQGRVVGLSFDGFIFNNFSQEHGESHKTQKDYFLAKCLLYKYTKDTGVIILNKGDKKVFGSKRFKKKNQIIFCFKKYDESNYHADNYEIIEETILKTTAKILYSNHEYIFSTRWGGDYNIENIFSSIMLIEKFFILDEKKIKYLFDQTAFFPDIAGRNEKYILNNGAIACIEKAPTPNSVTKTLDRLRQLTKHLIVVFGCGGNRDKKKRKIIAKLIEKAADIVIVAMDNPRFESIENIFKDISRGFSFSKNIFFIQDRKEAINQAIEKSTKNSIIALIGKGDEVYQEISGKKYPFSERNIIQEYVAY